MTLDKKTIISRKKQLILGFTLIVFIIFMGASIFAKTNFIENDYKINVSDEKIAQYLVAASKSKDITEKVQNYMLAANAVNKNPLTNDNAILLAYINYTIGRSTFELMNLNVATKAFQKSYYYLKLKKINKNNKIAFLNLLHLNIIAQMSNNEKAIIYYSEEIATTQTLFEKSNLADFKSIYESLSKFYSKNNNLKKSNYYKKKALSLSKQ